MGMYIGLSVLLIGFLLSLRIIMRKHEWGFQPAVAIIVLLCGWALFVIGVLFHH